MKLKLDIKQFIKKHLQLIDDGKWDEFYTEVEHNTSVGDVFQMDTDIGALTEFLMSCGCDPLFSMKRVPTCYLCGSNLPGITIPTGIWSIGCSAFAEMNNLTSVHIPQHVEVLNMHCFEYCPNLKYVKIDNPNISIHEDAFEGCESLHSIDFAGTVLEWREKDIILYDAVVTCTDGCVIYDKRGDFI